MNGCCVALVIVLLAASIKLLAFAMLRGYTEIDDDGASTAVALLACLVTLEASSHGSWPEQPTKSWGVVQSPNNLVWYHDLC